MSEALKEFKFRSASIFAGDTGTVDPQNCVIKGVSVITGGIEAEGHNLQVDDITVSQLQACAKSKGKVPVTLDHGSGVKDLNGYLTNFRMDGDKLRADWHLLKSHDETVKMLERAQVMPDCFGLSVAFKGPPKGAPIAGGKMAARCEKLLSVDCVTRPAANTGLFSAREVDNLKKVMADEIKGKAEPTLAEVLEAINGLTGRLDKHDEIFSQLSEENLPTLEELDQMSDEQLESLGLTRADVDTAVAEVLAAAGAEGDPNPAPEPEPEPGDGGGGTAAATVGAASTEAAGGVGTSAALKALQKEVVELKKKQNAVELKAKMDAENHEFEEIEGKVLTLASQRDKAIELAEKLQAENDALRLAVKTGTRPVKAGIDDGMRMFSANGEGQLHAFQQRVKQLETEGKSSADAITFAQKENPGLHADWLASLRKPVTAD